MAPKPTSYRAHRTNSVYSTPSSSRPSRHPSSLHRFSKFSPASRRAFHALFSRRLRRSPEAHPPSSSNEPDSRVTEERLRALTDENARLRARVVELMSRLLCGTTDESITAVDLNGEGVRAPVDVLNPNASEPGSNLHVSLLPKGMSAPSIIPGTTNDAEEAASPPSRAPSDGINPKPKTKNNEVKFKAESDSLRSALEKVATENERLKTCLTELQERSSRDLRCIEEEKEQLEERLSAAREDRELMENELCELREWSRRNIARKDAIVEAVKKELADSLEEVSRLTVEIDNIRIRNNNDTNTMQSVTPSVPTPPQSFVETEVVIEEDIISPDNSERTTLVAEGKAVTLPTDLDSSVHEANACVDAVETTRSTTTAVFLTEEMKNLVEEEPNTNDEVAQVEPDAESIHSEDKEVELKSLPRKDVERGQGESSENEEIKAQDTDKIPEQDEISPKLKLGNDRETMEETAGKKETEFALTNPLMKVEREQIIVGHFCGHVVQTVGHLVGSGKEVRTKEEQVKQLIAKQWEKWVAGSITKIELIDALVEWVRGCCDKGAETNVVQSFNAWYVAQYTQYKTRAGADQGTGAQGGNKVGRTASKPEKTSGPESNDGERNSHDEASSGSGNVAVPRRQRKISGLRASRTQKVERTEENVTTRTEEKDDAEEEPAAEKDLADEVSDATIPADDELSSSAANPEVASGTSS